MSAPIERVTVTALTEAEYATAVAALRLLEDEMADCGTPDALAEGHAAAAVRAKLRLSHRRDAAPVLRLCDALRPGAVIELLTKDEARRLAQTREALAALALAAVRIPLEAVSADDGEAATRRAALNADLGRALVYAMPYLTDDQRRRLVL